MIAFFLYIIIVNLASFHLFHFDKQRAECGKYRIPERLLLGISFLGGALGAFCAMREYHHKTLHTAFALSVPVALAVQLVLVIWVIVHCLIET